MSRVMKREPFLMSLQDTLSMMIGSGKPWAVVSIIFFFFYFFLSFKTKMYLGNYLDIFRGRTYNLPLTHFPKEVQLKKQIITTEVHFMEIALSFGDWLSTMRFMFIHLALKRDLRDDCNYPILQRKEYRFRRKNFPIIIQVVVYRL